MDGRFPFLSTSRLCFDQMSTADAPHVYELNHDPEVIRYTGDPPFDSVEAARQFLAGYRGYDQPGYGRMAVRLKADGSFLGWCGLKWADDAGEVDLGFRLMKKYWNRGYATEAARACLHHGFQTLELNRIIGRVMHENTASQRVLEKIGMNYWKDELCETFPSRYYKVEKNEYDERLR